MAGHGYHWENALAGVFKTVVPSDGATNADKLPKVPCAGLYVGSGGNLSVIDMDGNTFVFKNVASGQILPIKVQQVTIANTTAADIIALY